MVEIFGGPYFFSCLVTCFPSHQGREHCFILTCQECEFV
uniref:Uncharacterized protein n=1 Tax=Arundo donax TaxID=35708 RepID=A0A0A9AHK3_ARUDO